VYDGTERLIGAQWLPLKFLLWVTILGTLGIGSFIGSAVSLWFTARQQHRNWVNDSRKAEYRELLDVLYETVTAISANRPNLSSVNSEPVNEAVMKLARAFEDRMFIREALRKSGAYEDWLNIKKVIQYEPELQNLTPQEFRYSTSNLHQREDNLRKKILDVAHRDIMAFKLFPRS
jgi:hypothetical protein